MCCKPEFERARCAAHFILALRFKQFGQRTTQNAPCIFADRGDGVIRKIGELSITVAFPEPTKIGLFEPGKQVCPAPLVEGVRALARSRPRQSREQPAHQ